MSHDECCDCCRELPAVQQEAKWWKEHGEEWRARVERLERALREIAAAEVDGEPCVSGQVLWDVLEDKL